MSHTAEIEMASVDETHADMDELGLIQDLNQRLNAGFWHYDQYIAEAGQNTELQEFWRELKKKDQEHIRELKRLLADHLKADFF